MNSHRDNVKDAIKSCFVSFESGDYANELVCEIAVAVFNALGITEDEQNKVGGNFRLPVEKWQWKNTLPNDRYVIGVDRAEDTENEYTRRTKELAEGARYTREEFKSYTVGKVVGNPCVWYITLQTPIRKYRQIYSEGGTLEEAKTAFASFYYPQYLKDYERSTAGDKMDKE